MHSPYQMTVPCPDHNIQRLKDRVVIAKHYMYDEASGRSEDQSEELAEIAECLVEQCEFLDKKLYTRVGRGTQDQEKASNILADKRPGGMWAQMPWVGGWNQEVQG